MRILLLCLTFVFAGELEVEGDLKVTGSVDANGNPITNVGEPVLTSDVATANYVNTRTAGRGRIITLECPWHVNISQNPPSNENGGFESCEPPQCPEGWVTLSTSNKAIGISHDPYTNANTVNIIGNSIRYCIEQEDEE